MSPEFRKRYYHPLHPVIISMLRRGARIYHQYEGENGCWKKWYVDKPKYGENKCMIQSEAKSLI